MPRSAPAISPSASLRLVASWLANMLRRDGLLTQSAAVAGVRASFGDRFVVTSKTGRESIAPVVMGHFHELAPRAVYTRADRTWRAEPNDPAS